MNLVNINTLATISSPYLPSHVVMENKVGLVRWGLEKPMSKVLPIKELVGNREL